ncbi:MAG: DUF3575 domain-containing protein, partial [Bacteroidota bacterium]
VAPGIAYASNNFGVDEFTYRNLRVIPEFRYYLSPDYGADGLFVGAYGKLGFITATNKADDTTSSATRGALGILFGNKWVTDSGFLFELNLGLGRATIFGEGEEGDNNFAAAFSSITNIDLRIGIIAGYRF